MSNENQNQTVSKDANSSEVVAKPPFKERALNYIKENRSNILIGSLAVLVLFIIFAFLYFRFWYQSPIEKFADKFCACADESKSGFYNYAKDGFGYRSDLNGCFAEDFKAYGENFDKVEKKKMLEYFQQQVIEKCPEKLANVFENQ